MSNIVKEPCDCGSTSYYAQHIKFGIDGTRYSSCNDCTIFNVSVAPDVYFDKRKGANQTDPNLCERNGQQIPFSSKREKASILKRLGLREAGDKDHGSRNFDKAASKQWDNFK